MEKLDLLRLAEPSFSFAKELFAAYPELEKFSGMVQSKKSEKFDLAIHIPSPSGDAGRAISLWMEEGVDPSIEFGDWHMHFGLESNDLSQIVKLVKKIRNDQFVLLFDSGGEFDGHCDVLDLSIENSLVEALTNQHSPGAGTIKTWSGRGDRSARLSDLTLE